MKNRHRHLLSMVKKNWARMTIAMFCMLVMAGTEAGIPFLMKPAIDDIFIKRDMTMLKLIPLIFGAEKVQIILPMQVDLPVSRLTSSTPSLQQRAC